VRHLMAGPGVYICDECIERCHNDVAEMDREDRFEAMRLAVVAPDANRTSEFLAVAYTVFADGRLEIKLADGTKTEFSLEAWADIRHLGTEQVPRWGIPLGED